MVLLFMQPKTNYFSSSFTFTNIILSKYSFWITVNPVLLGHPFYKGKVAW